MSEYKDLLERVHSPGSSASWRHETPVQEQTLGIAEHAKALRAYAASLMAADGHGDSAKPAIAAILENVRKTLRLIEKKL